MNGDHWEYSNHADGYIMKYTNQSLSFSFSEDHKALIQTAVSPHNPTLSTSNMWCKWTIQTQLELSSEKLSEIFISWSNSLNFSHFQTFNSSFLTTGFNRLKGIKDQRVVKKGEILSEREGINKLWTCLL